MHAIKSDPELANQARSGEIDVLLSVCHLRKSFLSPTGGPIQVLRDITFSAEAGEAIAIMGASGAGKSTLLHLLGGLESADDGKISLAGTPLAECSATQLARLRNRSIGFVFQFHHLLSDLSALQNVAMPLMISGLGRRESLTRAKVHLESLGLGDRLDHAITYLSGGEQQRVAVARALVTEPMLVLADEPTGNLDSVIEEDISRSLITYAKEQRKLLIVATHNEHLARMCHRLLLLKNGRLDELSSSGA